MPLLPRSAACPSHPSTPGRPDRKALPLTALLSPGSSGCGPPSRLGVPETPVLPSRAWSTRPHSPGLKQQPLQGLQTKGRVTSELDHDIMCRPPRDPQVLQERLVTAPRPGPQVSTCTPSLGEALAMEALPSPRGLGARHPTVCSPAPAVPGPQARAGTRGGHAGSLHRPPVGPALHSARAQATPNCTTHHQDRRTECPGAAAGALPGRTHLGLSRQRALERHGCGKQPSGPAH